MDVSVVSQANLSQDVLAKATTQSQQPTAVPPFKSDTVDISENAKALSAKSDADD